MTQVKQLPEAISIQQTAQILSVCDMTVRRWIQRGFIKAYRVGPFLIRIPRSELIRMRALRLQAQEEQERPRYEKV